MLGITGLGKQAVAQGDGDPPSEPPANPEPAKLYGTWRPASGLLGGQELPMSALHAMTLTISEDGYVFETNGLKDAGQVKFDLEVAPRHIDCTGVEGPNRGRTLVGIFKLDGDRLTICYNLEGNTRPADFKSPEGSQILLLSYDREKTDQKVVSDQK